VFKRIDKDGGGSITMSELSFAVDEDVVGSVAEGVSLVQSCNNTPSKASLPSLSDSYSAIRRYLEENPDEYARIRVELTNLCQAAAGDALPSPSRSPQVTIPVSYKVVSSPSVEQQLEEEERCEQVLESVQRAEEEADEEKMHGTVERYSTHVAQKLEEKFDRDITPVKEALAGSEMYIQEMRDEVDASKAEAEIQAKLVAELEGTVMQLTSDLSARDTTAQQLQAELDAKAAEVQRLQESESSLKQAVASGNGDSAVAEAFAASDKRIAEMTEELNFVRADVITKSNLVTELETVKAEAAEHMAELSAELDTVRAESLAKSSVVAEAPTKSEADEGATRIAAPESSTSAMQAELDAKAAEVQRLQESESSLKQAVASGNGDSAVAEALAASDKRIAELTAQAEAAAVEMNKLNTEVAHLRDEAFSGDLVDLKKKNQEMSAQLLRFSLHRMKQSRCDIFIFNWLGNKNLAAADAAKAKSKRLMMSIQSKEAEQKEMQKEIEQLRNGIDTKAKANEEKAKKGTATNQLLTGISVLDVTIKLQMNPMQYRKAGAVIQNMLDAGYSDAACNTICRALFLEQSKEDMKAAWHVFAKQKSCLSTHEFRKVLPLMGENVPEEEINALFQMADEDGSGEIEFDEFVMLVKAMNPKESQNAEAINEDQGKKSGLFGFAGKFGF